MRRITILLAALGALLLLPAASAFANGVVTVTIEGSGGGEVSSVGGIGAAAEEYEEFGNLYEGEPPIECKYTPPGPATGECVTELVEEEEFIPGFGLLALHAVPAPGYGVKWIVKGEGERFSGCETSLGCLVTGEGGTVNGNVEVTAFFAPHYLLSVSRVGTGSGSVESFIPGGLRDKKIDCGSNCSGDYEVGTEVELRSPAETGSKFAGWSGCTSEEEVGGQMSCFVTMSKAKSITAAFCLIGQSKAECLGGGGPTNLRTLILTKSGNGPGGTGSVSSKPKGIKCGTTCTEAVAAEYKDTPVVLTEKPGGESTFVEWTGACSGSSPTCTVPMAEDESVGAVFAGTSKTITPTEALTLEKAGTGKGTVKAAGLGCEAECTSTMVLYQGPVTEPKAKPGKIVVLKQAPAFGSKFSGWSGCDSIDGEGNCVVAMETAKTVKAEYAALPNKVLTVNKAYASGNGSVSSKPKGIKCGTACTQAVAQMPEGAAVELTAKPGSETTFVEWVGGDCSGSSNPVCVVTMNTDETTKAVFSKPSKALAGGSEATLTLSKAGSGFGTVKAAGLGCEWLCTSTSVVYQGPVTEPKAKPGKVVILKALSAPGSKKVLWSGCDSEDAEGNCVVAMEASRSVTATFDELE